MAGLIPVPKGLLAKGELSLASAKSVDELHQHFRAISSIIEGPDGFRLIRAILGPREDGEDWSRLIAFEVEDALTDPNAWELDDQVRHTVAIRISGCERFYPEFPRGLGPNSYPGFILTGAQEYRRQHNSSENLELSNILCWS